MAVMTKTWHCPECQEQFTIASTGQRTWFLTYYGAYDAGSVCPRCQEGVLLEEEQPQIWLHFFNPDQADDIHCGPFPGVMLERQHLYAVAGYDQKQPAQHLYSQNDNGLWQVNGNLYCDVVIYARGE